MKPMRIAAVVVGLAGLALVYAHAQDKVVLEDFLEQPPLPPPLNLPLIAPERVPETGNFYSAGREWPPLPFNPYADETNVPVYSLGAAMGKKANAPFYLFDDRAVVAFEELALAAAEARAAADPKAKGLSRTEPAGPQSAGRGVVPTGTDLLLDIEDVTNGVISLKIYNPDAMTNNPVWDVWAATKFSGNPDNWTWIVRTEPGQTNLLVTMLSETQGYLRLGATNNTHSASNILDSWMSQNFGHVLEWSSDHTGATNDYDSDGVNNYDEFMAGSDPNSFSFTAHFPSLFVNQQTIYGTCAVQGGVPFAMAVLVNRTNVTPGDWLPYSANFSATLGSTDGAYAVRVLLRGRPADATPVFNDTEITLDRVAPVVVIKNPVAASATVTRPYLQLLGNANEPLAALTYDIGNAAGTRTNLPVSVIDQAFNTNSFDFTTNYFQAYDVALATNANNITLRVTDRAGNMTTTNLTVTLDYTGATNSPVLQLTWPTNGMSVSGESFYVRGQINDETASLSAQIVDVNNVTNDYAGLIERNGTLWLGGLPLAAGTNVVQLIATDAAGNTSQTSLTVIQSSVALSITSAPEGEALYESVGNVSGTVGGSGYSVSVNGVAATVDGNNWSAENRGEKS